MCCFIARPCRTACGREAGAEFIQLHLLFDDIEQMERLATEAIAALTFPWTRSATASPASVQRLGFPGQHLWHPAQFHTPPFSPPDISDQRGPQKNGPRCPRAVAFVPAWLLHRRGDARGLQSPGQALPLCGCQVPG